MLRHYWRGVRSVGGVRGHVHVAQPVEAEWCRGLVREAEPDVMIDLRGCSPKAELAPCGAAARWRLARAWAERHFFFCSGHFFFFLLWPRADGAATCRHPKGATAFKRQRPSGACAHVGADGGTRGGFMPAARAERGDAAVQR